MNRRMAMGLMAGTVTTLLAGCSSSKSRYRQRMTVEVATPQGIRKGSSVVEVGNAAKPEILKDIPGNGYSVRGEAVAVDLDHGKVLFALLIPAQRGTNADWYQAMLISDALREGAPADPPLTLPDGGYGVAAYRLIGASHVKVTLPPKLYPLLVTFRDIHDPTSVERVDPADLAASFGTGVSLRSITVEVTDAEMTTGIERTLRWPSSYPEPRLDKDYKGSTSPNLSQKIEHGNFRRGFERWIVTFFSQF